MMSTLSALLSSAAAATSSAVLREASSGAVFLLPAFLRAVAPSVAFFFFVAKRCSLTAAPCGAPSYSIGRRSPVSAVLRQSGRAASPRCRDGLKPPPGRHGARPRRRRSALLG